MLPVGGAISDKPIETLRSTAKYKRKTLFLIQGIILKCLYDIMIFIYDIIFRSKTQDLTHFFRYPILSDSYNWIKTGCPSLFLITEIITARDDSESNNDIANNQLSLFFIELTALSFFFLTCISFTHLASKTSNALYMYITRNNTCLTVLIYCISLTFVLVCAFIRTITRINQKPSPTADDAVGCTRRINTSVDEMTCAVCRERPPFGENGSDHRRGAQKGSKLCP